MAVSTKAVASGVAGVGGTAAAGYGISTAIEQQNSGSQQTQSQNPKVVSEQEPLTIAKKLKEDGYTVLDLNANRNEWWVLASAAAMKEGKSADSDFEAKKQEFQKICKVLLNVEYSEDRKVEYNKAFEKCTELESLKKTSEKLGLISLTKNHKEIIKSKWTKTSNKSITGEFGSSGLVFSDDVDYSLAENRCEIYSSRFNRFNSSELKTKLSNYQKLCTATSEEISKQSAS